MLTPMFILVLFTALIGILMLKMRIQAVKNKEIHHNYFKEYNMEQKIPSLVHRTGRHFDNLLQTPMLFYIAGALFVSQNIENTLSISLAWLYLASRILHAYFHLGKNNIIHRMLAFFLGFFIILALWIILILKLS